MQSPSSPKIIDVLEHSFMNHLAEHFLDQFFYENNNIVGDLIQKLRDLTDAERDELITLVPLSVQENLIELIDICIIDYAQLDIELELYGDS
jgi:hypothetical protein